MVEKRMFKAGFSLAEALVVMLVLSVFLAASSKVITKKRPVELASYVHGQYECWNSGGTYYQQYVFEGTPSTEQKVSSCKFIPRINASVYHIYMFFDKENYYQTEANNITKDITIKSLSASTIVLENSDGSVQEYTKDQEGVSVGEIKEALEFLYPDSNILTETFGSNRPSILIAW